MKVTPTKFGFYVVVCDEQLRIVMKDKTCSCGRGDCTHVQAVADYIKAGGVLAQNVGAVSESRPERRLTECPICGGSIVYGKYAWSDTSIWHCNDSSHYWLWRAEVVGGGAARKWMTRFQDEEVDEYCKFLEEVSGET